MQPMMEKVGDLEVPHWALRPEDEWVYFESFPDFVKLVWAALDLPPPTRRQLQIAARMAQCNGGKHDIIRAFRGVGKSFLAAAFTLWRLMRNPREEKILVVSATGTKARDFVSQVKKLMNVMDLLAFLRPNEDQRDMADAFDVNGASIAQSKSVTARGITSQITGGRATLIIPDDVEIPANSKTEEARARLMHYTSEFEAILVPIYGDVLFLGTPQTEESIYNRLVKQRGYTSYTVPARYPFAEKRAGYVLRSDTGHEVDILADDLVREFDQGLIAPGDPTDPERFDRAELAKKESKGRAFFALQYQLDTTLSDAERYPLRQRDMIVFTTNIQRAPRAIAWGLDTNRGNVIHDIPNLGFSGDLLLRPLFHDPDWREYDTKGVLFVDPAGVGADETAWTVIKTLNGMMYVLRCTGHRGTPKDAMVRIALDAKHYDVAVVEVEPNMAGGIWIEAFRPVLVKTWPGGCSVIESEWAKGQKETRIIDTLEPALTGHRLVFDEATLRDQTAESLDRDYSLLFQMTHITRDRKSLVHDDRLDSLAGAVNHMMRALGLDVDTAAAEQRAAEVDAYIDRYAAEVRDGSMGRMRGLFRDGKRQRSMKVVAGQPALVYEGDDDEDVPNDNWGAYRPSW